VDVTGGAGLVDTARRSPATSPGRASEHSARIQPLLGEGGKATFVDHHPICSVCGKAIEPVSLDAWAHSPRGRPFRGRSKWLLPAALETFRALGTYAAFRAQYMSQVRADLGAAFSTSEAEWREGLQRLQDHAARLAAARRRRTLEAGENPYLDLFRSLTAPPLSLGVTQMLHLAERRRELAACFAWAIPSDEALEVLARYAPLVECGAGMGYWTSLAQARGIDVVAYDLIPPGRRADNEYHARDRRPWTSIRRGSSVTAVSRHRDRVLFVCWPPYDDDAASYAALRAYDGDVLVYVGEPGEGATGSVRFHRELQLNWTLAQEVTLPRWPRLHDSLLVYRRNAVRRPHRERDRCFGCHRFIRTGAIGRCDWCFRHRPTALALKVGRYRVEYPRDTFEAMPLALRRAVEQSPNRIR